MVKASQCYSKHGWVCEKQQGMPSHSTRSESPFSSGRHAGRQQEEPHRQDQHSSSTQGVHAMAPSPVRQKG